MTVWDANLSLRLNYVLSLSPHIIESQWNLTLWACRLQKIVFFFMFSYFDRLCGLVVRVPGYKSRGPGSIPGTTRFSEK
jgi:hypothetical protein